MKIESGKLSNDKNKKYFNQNYPKHIMFIESNKETKMYGKYCYLLKDKFSSFVSKDYFNDFYTVSDDRLFFRLQESLIDYIYISKDYNYYDVFDYSAKRKELGVKSIYEIEKDNKKVDKVSKQTHFRSNKKNDSIYSSYIFSPLNSRLLFETCNGEIVSVTKI